MVYTVINLKLLHQAEDLHDNIAYQLFGSIKLPDDTSEPHKAQIRTDQMASYAARRLQVLRYISAACQRSNATRCQGP